MESATLEEIMTVKRPTPKQMMDIVESMGMSMTMDRVEEFLGQMAGSFARYDIVDAMPDYVPTVEYPRTPGYFPPPSENKYNAWYVKSEIKGAPTGPLVGKTVAVKDNVCVAGVPMMNGSSTLEGYVPNIDATIVTRLLDAGATIKGKAHCELFCLSGGSHTNSTGPTHNPHKMGYSAGGSSSGSGALVAAGEVDMAIGGDQGGSIRMPASYCGIYGMKPTHGLVPYTGVMPIEATIDHTGPMTATVADNALMLSVLAGPDGLDPRQYAPVIGDYVAALSKSVAGMKIGVVKEGFGHVNSEPDVDAKVRLAAEKFKSLGAEVTEISIPMHMIGTAIWTPIALEGLQAQMMNGNGMGFNWKGLYTTSLLDAHAAWRNRADELSDSLKISMMVAQYFVTHYRGHYYAKAQNLARKLKATYDAVFDDYDLLLMPTLPVKATPLPPADAPLALYLQRAFEMLANTAPFDVTGHPAMSLPCGMSDGLPIGLMLVAKDYGEEKIYTAASAFEASGDWKSF
jgi:amidase